MGCHIYPWHLESFHYNPFPPWMYVLIDYSPLGYFYILKTDFTILHPMLLILFNMGMIDMLIITLAY